jgi:hypothetical protein
VSLEFAPTINATTPVTIGAAALVPEKSPVQEVAVDPGFVVVIPQPRSPPDGAESITAGHPSL